MYMPGSAVLRQPRLEPHERALEDLLRATFRGYAN
jgi:hypothetical protein